jgi:integrase/recombinase XerD
VYGARPQLQRKTTSNPMGGIVRRRDREGQDRWWLTITGKGDKERLLLATTELMAELARYRRHYGLAVVPYGGETTPLLLSTVTHTGR